MQQQHTEFDCFCNSLMISEDYPFIAATPDGFGSALTVEKGYRNQMPTL